MADTTHAQINEYAAVSVHLASPNDIRSWSYGEVRKAETINYRSYRPEKEGLFCEKIFGPERDWECACGRYRGAKYKDIVCPRCGVKVTTSKVRRHRMGHINLASPVVHIWFFKAVPSRLALLLGVKSGELQQVIYYQRYIVIDAGSSKLDFCQILSEEDYQKALKEYGEGSFRAGMGGEAVKEILQTMDLAKSERELRKAITVAKAASVKPQLLKRLKVVQMLLASGNQSEWMVLDVIPVIPPDLRPLLPLESGNFATSDLNDLYRRVINRNNRLKKLLDLNAPSVIIRNEKRMLQQAVDALFDNSRCRRPVLGTGNRPLRSLADTIKGKQGRFRGNLLGKRVDYSGRSVIVVGPNLRLDQCGVPKKMALELFQPFVIRRLRENGHADTIKSAKRLLERQEKEVWDVLEEVIKGHVVMLNRAPTLHRMSIQGFYPVLVEGDSLMLHPLVCNGFNADFDGDQMAVHVPLSVEAQIEAKFLILASHNIFSPANGSPIISPDRDIVLGCYYLTSEGNRPEKPKTFGSTEEVLLALDQGAVGLREVVRVRLDRDRVVLGLEGRQKRDSGVYETTPGRAIFNDAMPAGMAYYNVVMTKKQLGRVIRDCHRSLDRGATVRLLDAMKDVGFHYATVSGLSFAATDLVTPQNKEGILKGAEKAATQVMKAYSRGLITEGERYNQIIDIWTGCRDRVWDELMEELRLDEREEAPEYVNPLFMMVDSGARGSMQQMGQLAGMRGLMAKPSGKVIEVPIKANFREGLRSFEYFSSTHGARKGLADTALKTANSGYLTRKLVEVAQDVTVVEHDCGTQSGITKGAIYRGEYEEVSLAEATVGRTARDTIVDPVTDEVVVRENEIITEGIARRLEEMRLDRIRVRSPLTCEAEKGICALCYGMDLSTGRLVEEGLAAGIIAAQSIGEPGTQLTMRTFHVGGIGITRVEESEIKIRHSGEVRFHNLKAEVNKEGKRVSLDRNGEIIIVDHRERELERHILPTGAELRVEENQHIETNTVVATWDPHMIPILTEVQGRIRYEDIIEDETMRKEIDSHTGITRKVIVEHKGDFHPQIVVEDETGHPVGIYPMPEKANIEVDEGEAVQPGDMLAKTPREFSGAQDITGGLTRATNLFEARKPKDAAVMSEIDGIVEIGERKRGKRTIIVRGESGISVEHTVPQGKHILVHTGDRVAAGDRLVDGPLDPFDVLKIKGLEKTQEYLLQEVQAVYRSQNVTINDKHLEIIVSRMFQKVEIEDAGDTHFLPQEQVDRWVFRRENEEVMEKGGKPAVGKPLLLGIARASLLGDSFLAAASFQETTKVLTDAALSGQIDTLRGLKENVILGHIIPAGTGNNEYYNALTGRRALQGLPGAGNEEAALTAGD